MSFFSLRRSICLLVFTVPQFFIVDARAEVDVQSELQLAQQHNAVSLRLWTAEVSLARLRLTQLKKLRRLGHASWLEVAQAELMVDQHSARRDLELQMADYLSKLSEHVTKHPATRAVHAVRIVNPRSGRLIGWFDADTLPREWVADSSQPIESNSQDVSAERQRAERSLSRVDRLREAGCEDESLEFQFAQLERDVAVARAELADLENRQAKADWDVQRVIEAGRAENPSMAGGPANLKAALKPPRCSLSLARATTEVVALEAQCDEQIRLSELVLEKSRHHLTAIEQLHRDGHASQQELQTAQKRVTDAERQRDGLVRRGEYLADQVARRTFLSWIPMRRECPDREVYWQQITSQIEHPTVLRHLIDVRRRRVTQQAAHRVLVAQLRLAEAMGERLLSASRQRDLREQESNDLDQRILRARMAAVDQLDTVLEHEEWRFVRYLAPRLQGKGGGLPDWMVLAVGRSAVGRLALCGILVGDSDRRQRPIVYLDTYSVIDPVSLCLTPTCDEDSMCETAREGAPWRLRSAANRIDASWRTASTDAILLPRSALVSQYDLQRICSYYCDLPGSVCPQPTLGTSRLFSSYAVPVSPSLHFVSHDDWLGIRTVNYALSHTGYRKYPGLDDSGIPIYEPVIDRVKQSVRYRPSFRLP